MGAGKARLRSELSQPEVQLLGKADRLTYEKGTAFVLLLHITDDFGVESAEGWARPEGGTYVRIPLRRGSSGDYELEVPPSLHQNKTVNVYVVATDRSGHKGQLGDPSHPIQIKRKGLFSKIFGKDGG